MKPRIFIAVVLVFCVEIFSGCAKKNSSTSWQSLKNPEIVAKLKSFVAAKQKQANLDATNTPVEFKTFYAAAERGDWIGVSNAFVDFHNHAPQYEHSGKTDLRLRGTPWQTVLETWGTFDAVFEGGEKYSKLYADEIINSIPPGSIYFGATDAGRFLITGMQKSQINGEPFFTVSQNPMADSTYDAYLREIYGGKIYVPTDNDVSQCFQDYQQDFQKRKQDHQLKPGEDATIDSDGRLQIKGQMAVIEIYGRIAKVVFNQNTNRECYVEESFPIEWMNPYLEPHGVIMKLNHQPLAQLSDKMVQRDEDYWSKLISPMIGDWLNKETSLADVTEFVEKVYGKKDLNGFTGDKEFLQSEYFQKTFSKERENIAMLYAWRARQATDPVEKQRMNDAADFAFRQAFVLCPYSAEVVVSYVALLTNENKNADALLVAEATAKTPQMQGSNGDQIRDVINQLKRNAN